MMRKFLSAALIAATLAGTVGMAATANAQEWGGPPPPPPAYDHDPGGWAPPPPPPAWDRGPGQWGPPRGDYWQQERYRQWRYYQEMRHREYCRWHRCW